VTTGNLSVIVVSHQSAAVLARCLDGLPVELQRQAIVVDNASTDGSAALAAAHGVRVVESGANLGYARAANLGAEAAAGAVLCFLNPDCLPSTELLEAGVAAVAGGSPVAAVPDLRDADGAIISGRQPGYTRLKLLADIFDVGRPTRALARVLLRMERVHDRSWWWPHGACLFVGRSTFRALGGFDSRYFLYMEDVDFGRRLCTAGGALLALGVLVDHSGGGGAAVDPYRRRDLLLAARLLYARYNYGRMLAWTLAATAMVAVPPAVLARRVR
jgi:N-acetylglucosaminyl-diphospho-decaprenol L-rhamnosyltransferase